MFSHIYVRSYCAVIYYLESASWNPFQLIDLVMFLKFCFLWIRKVYLNHDYMLSDSDGADTIHCYFFYFPVGSPWCRPCRSGKGMEPMSTTGNGSLILQRNFRKQCEAQCQITPGQRCVSWEFIWQFPSVVNWGLLPECQFPDAGGLQCIWRQKDLY